VALIKMYSAISVVYEMKVKNEDNMTHTNFWKIRR